jgi:modulator of FtsH protease
MSYTATSTPTSELTTNRVLRNTYALLSMTLLSSAVTASLSMAMGLSHTWGLILSLAAFVPLYITYKNAETSMGLVWIFAFTSIEGAAIGPILNHYAGMNNGPMLITQALGLTSVIFMSLSVYAMRSRKDFSFLGAFVFAGFVVMFALGLINYFFVQSSGMFLAINGCIAMLATAAILYDTSRIIHGGETNYIRATISLYLDFLNLFLSLLHLLGAFNDD